LLSVFAVIAMVALARRYASVRAGVVLGALVVAGMCSGAISDARLAPAIEGTVPDGRFLLTARVVEDPVIEWGGIAVADPIAANDIPWAGPRLGVRALSPEVQVGDTIWVRGTLEAEPRRVRNDHVAGVFRVDEVERTEPSRNPLFVMGNGLRARVRTAFGDQGSSSALVTGLLIGDTSGVPSSDLEDLRLAGLSHFVAVSGSNVAMFLLAWWIVGAPLSIRPRLRVVYGLVGLGVFAVVTRWEPSVIRASVMAAVPLVGGLIDVPVDPWMALGVAASVLLLVSADLATSVGFLLSVLATAGVLVGVGFVRGRRPVWLWVPLGATVGAQVAVSPLLIAVFGSIPLVAPLTNLVAAPVVSFTSMIGLVAVVAPIPLITRTARFGADLILRIAEIGAGGPQLGLGASLAFAVLIGLVAVRGTRPVGLALLVLAVIATMMRPSPWPSVPTAVVLDVGQGDAILVQDPTGSTVLVDGGSDPGVLDAALRRQNVRTVDLLVATHGDADHVGGLTELVASGRVGAVWVGDFNDPSDLLVELIDAAGLRGVEVTTVSAGDRSTVASLSIEVLGPTRRFQSENDGSVILFVKAGRSLLLPGDIEAVAQRELPVVQPDVLVVPHHGSGTTDLDWLERTVGDLAVLSYGENRYGHPHPDVIVLLEDLGVSTRRTHLEGDIVVPLDVPP
jgi:competence protein ComEC